ncbi:MAG: hypothetical protein Ct9H300mP25_12730 [Acidobacteriota bacterium]|nr:MAG: hypothetical protein Ct9H300mP25_12730 [Acidobacteriota bacterium]
MADDRPYELLQNGEATGIVELPVEWILDDARCSIRAAQAIRHHATYSRSISKIRKSLEEGRFFLYNHPHFIGHRSRILILEELISHIQSVGNAWFATHEQVARYFPGKARSRPGQLVTPFWFPPGVALAE